MSYESQPKLFDLPHGDLPSGDVEFGRETFLDAYDSCLDPEGDQHDVDGINALIEQIPRNQLDEYFEVNTEGCER